MSLENCPTSFTSRLLSHSLQDLRTVVGTVAYPLMPTVMIMRSYYSSTAHRNPSQRSRLGNSTVGSQLWGTGVIPSKCIYIRLT